MTDPAVVESVARDILADPWLGHSLFFKGRWSAPPAPFHREIAADFWRGARRKQVLGFRGCGKSTTGESNLALAGALRVFRNIVIVGASEARAAERLAPVSRQLEYNEALLEVFGAQRGSGVWTQTKIVLTSGYCIQALGRDQDIRGIKHLDWRPDLVFVDDFEDKSSVQTPAQREKTYDWFLAELLLACEPDARIFINGTPLDEDSVPMRLQRAGWPTRLVPVEHLDAETGERKASWPERFPLSWIDDNRRLYVREGKQRLWDAEMMMQPRAAGSLMFRKETFRTVPRQPSWQAVYAMIDPARTTRQSSATTGWAVWSWLRNRLVVWAAGAEMLKPDEIVALCFELHARFGLTWLGVEVDGLEEFLMQPLRAEMVRRGTILPLKGVRAPRSKFDFIAGLEAFFAAGEVEFASAMPELEEQLLGFPTGRIDAPNALAYSLLLRPGGAVYEDFGEEHIADALDALPDQPLYIAGNSDGRMTTAVLVQRAEGEVRVLADWVREGTPSETVGEIHADAMLVADTGRWTERRETDPEQPFKLPILRPVRSRLPVRWVVPGRHREGYRNVGLCQALRAVPAGVSAAGETSWEAAAGSAGQRALGEILRSRRRGRPGLLVAPAARWTLRAFAGGYARSLDRRGLPAGEPDIGIYRLLMEGIEAFAGIGRALEPKNEDEAQPIAYNRHGIPYRSALPGRLH